MEIYKNMMGRWRWVAKLVARLLATAGLWVRIQKSLIYTKMGDIRKGMVSTCTLARQKYLKKMRWE
jgi:hypothetical protein